VHGENSSRPAAVGVTSAPSPVTGVVTAILGQGTAEARWQQWGRLGTLPRVLAADLGPDLLVVAPHPDDEVLGAGGLLALAGGEVVAVTDGEASHPQSDAVDRADLVAARRAETAAALGLLGRGATAVHRLAHPDGAVEEDRLADELTALLSRPASVGARGWTCVATWRGDGHPDHEAVGRAAARACGRTGARLVEYPVWMWHWAAPGDDRVPWDRAVGLPLPRVVRDRKRAATAAFVSQVQPLGPDPADAAILPPHVLDRFDRDQEVFFT